MRSEYWEQQVLRVFTCSCHQRRLRQPLLGVTNEDTHIDHLVNEKRIVSHVIWSVLTNYRPVLTGFLVHSANILQAACWDIGQRYESQSSSILFRSQETSFNSCWLKGFSVYSFIVALGWILVICENSWVCMEVECWVAWWCYPWESSKRYDL